MQYSKFPDVAADNDEEKIGDGPDTAESRNTEELPELLELIDAVEEAASNISALSTVIQNIGRRIRATPADRDLLTDFDGTTNICKALSEAPHNWQGEAMLAFCRVMPDVCRTSNVNRGALRDEGFVKATVELLAAAVATEDEAASLACSIAINATCTANDGNKRVVSVVSQLLALDAGDPDAAVSKNPGALVVLVEALARFPNSVALQTEAIAAFRSLITDDDNRKASCEPAAVENREFVMAVAFPTVRAAVQHALIMGEAGEKPRIRLQEQALLLLREIARGPDIIHGLAFDENRKMLKCAQACVETADPRVLRATFSVLRAFASDEEVRDDFAILTDGAQKSLAAIRRHIAVPIVCEQGFGLMANLTMRKSTIAGKLNDGEQRLVSLGEAILLLHPTRPDVTRSVAQALRNAATQEDSIATEVRESQVFSELRRVVKDHEQDPRWNSAVDISRQFLREFRADQGVEKAAQYNAYY